MKIYICSSVLLIKSTHVQHWLWTSGGPSWYCWPLTALRTAGTQHGWTCCGSSSALSLVRVALMASFYALTLWHHALKNMHICNVVYRWDWTGMGKKTSPYFRCWGCYRVSVRHSSSGLSCSRYTLVRKLYMLARSEIFSVKTHCYSLCSGPPWIPSQIKTFHCRCKSPIKRPPRFPSTLISPSVSPSLSSPSRSARMATEC